MPIVEKPLTEPELRAQIARLQTLIKNNPATAADQTRRLSEVQKELNNLLLAQGGYSIVKDVDVEARVAAAHKEGHAAGIAEAAAAVAKTE